MSNKFADKPVAFLAVNSGNPRAKVASYARTNEVPWPVIVDTDREFEKECGLKTKVSLKNIYQAVLVRADGSHGRVAMKQMAERIEEELEDAKWSMNPDDVPPELKTAWRAAEFCNYDLAAKGIKQGLKSRNSELKEAATRLEANVLKRLKDQSNDAFALARNGEYWAAYQDVVKLCKTFGDFELPNRLISARKTLSKKPEVKAELAATKKLSLAIKLANSGNKRKTAAAKKHLTAIVDDFPETEAAKRAQTILSKSE